MDIFCIYVSSDSFECNVIVISIVSWIIRYYICYHSNVWGPWEINYFV